MEEKDAFFSRVPNWLRWIIALPFAVICCIIVPLICVLVNSFYYGTADSLWMRLISMISSVIGFLYGLYYCVPKFKEIITGVFSILFTVYFAVMITIMCSRGYIWTTDNLINLIASILSIVMAVYFILEHRKEELE